MYMYLVSDLKQGKFPNQGHDPRKNVLTAFYRMHKNISVETYLTCRAKSEFTIKGKVCELGLAEVLYYADSDI